jgi:hypothetical protein
VEKTEGKSSLGRNRCRKENNIKVGLKGIRYEVVDLVNLVQDSDKWPAVVKKVMNLRVP